MKTSECFINTLCQLTYKDVDTRIPGMYCVLNVINHPRGLRNNSAVKSTCGVGAVISLEIKTPQNLLYHSSVAAAVIKFDFLLKSVNLNVFVFC